MTVGNAVRIKHADGKVVVLHIRAVADGHAMCRWWEGRWHYGLRTLDSLRALVVAGIATVTRPNGR